METDNSKYTDEDELSPSKHEQAAQVLNRSCPPPSSSKVSDDIGNGATSLNNHQTESNYNPVKILASSANDSKEKISKEESHSVDIVSNHIKECNR